MPQQNKVTTPVARASFADVFRSRSFEGGEPKFGLTLIFDSDADLSALKRLAAAAIKAKWSDKTPKNLRSPFRDGDDKDLDGYAGTTYIRATSIQRPKVVDQNLQEITDEAEFYSGCYCRASLTAFAYDKAGNKGVSFGLLNVQKIKDGEAFGGVRSKPEDDFGEVASGSSSTSAEDDDLPF